MKESIYKLIYAKGVIFTKIFLATYQCTRCGHKWYKILISFKEEDVSKCLMGCSNLP